MKKGPTIGMCWRVPLAVCSSLLVGCWGVGLFQDEVDPVCLELDWASAATEAVHVESDTFEAVLARVVLEVPLIDGDWADDFGDARFYAPAILVGLGHEIDSPCLLAFGQASLEGNRRLIWASRCDLLSLFSFWPQLPEQVMAAYGLIDAYQYDRRAEDIGLIDVVLDRVNPALEAFGLYPNELTESLLSLYGPTTQTAALAVLNLRYAIQIGGPRGPGREEFGLRLIDAIDERAYEPERGIYRFSGKNAELHLYPNTMMIIANCLAYQATGKTRYLDRARSTFESVQQLKDPDQGNYRSPYSAGMMGARTEDYSTLSSQLYLITALCLLYERTGEEKYVNEAREVLQFVCKRLREDGRLVHHWIDGRPARPEGPTYYCSGCNFQALYVMWYMAHLQSTQVFADPGSSRVGLP